MQTLFVDVLLPLPLPQSYTYRVPGIFNDFIQERTRVVVQFGRNKLYSALVLKIHNQAPEQYQAKYIEEILDDKPIVTPQQIKFWSWLAEYYACTLGEVYNAALPSGLKLSSETILVKHPDFSDDFRSLNDKEYLVAEALSSNDKLTLKEVSDILGQKTIMPIVHQLISKKVAIAEEDLKFKYKPRIEDYVRLTSGCRNEEVLSQKFDELTKAPKQLEVLLQYMKLSKWHSPKPTEVKKTLLYKAAEANLAQVKALVDKGILEIYSRQEGRLSPFEKEDLKEIELNQHQKEAYTEILAGFSNKKVTLLHGVTGSGKTEIYLSLIQKTIDEGKNVLYLVPEIALTTQLVNRLKVRLGNQLGVYHSKFNEQERVEIWSNTLGGKNYRVLIGARSTIFLPISDLGLVIVDEEHENSYKQYDPAPRYQARDAAIVLGLQNEAHVLLGSATPSLDSYHNARSKKYHYVQLSERHGAAELPEITIANISEARKKKTLKSQLTPELFNAISEALEKKEQVILFKNRRGFAPYLKCDKCSWIPECKNCDISLTYHKFKNQLNCHYCGFSSPVPTTCGACGSSDVQLLGFGTEQIEEELEILFPEKRVMRMDLDTTRNKNNYQRMISDFENREIDILVGTQMITKGLDFDNVSVVGILSADDMLHYPDFRAFERSFQIMEQVAGRAGRSAKKGKVIIQTHEPEHPIIRQVAGYDYEGMAIEQFAHRKQFHYPPFTRLINISVRNKSEQNSKEHAQILAKELRKSIELPIMGPEKPGIGRVRNWFIQNILIKFPKGSLYAENKQKLQEIINDLSSQKVISGSRVSIDVDPQ